MSLFKRCRTLSIVLFSLAVIAGLEMFGHARPPHGTRPPFKVGDTVEFQWLGGMMQGEVMAIDARIGLATVRFDYRGKERTWRFPWDQLQPVRKSSAGPSAKGAAPKSSDAGSPGERGKMRTWTDSTGKYKTKARFLELKDGRVRLKKADGTTTTLPLEKLCDADQRLVEKLAKKSADQNPFASDAEKETFAEMESPEASTKEGDWMCARRVNVDPTARGAITPDAADGHQYDRFRPFPLAFQQNASVFVSVSGIFTDSRHERLVVAFIDNDPSGGQGLRLERCNLKTAKSIGSLTLPTSFVPVDLSSDGTSIACVSDGHGIHDKQTVVEVWRLDRKGTLVNRWDAKTTSGHGIHAMGSSFQAIDKALFLTPDRLLVVDSKSGTVTLWNVKDAKAVYTISSLNRHSMPALSANHKQLAVTTRDGIGILDAGSGDTLAFLPGKSDQNVVLAFRSDGKQLAALSRQRVQVWDLEKKEVVREVWFPPQKPKTGIILANNLDWLNDDYLLVDGSLLIDLRKRVVLWKYQLPGEGRPAVIDDKLCYVLTQMQPSRRGMGHQSGVFFTALPHPEAVQVAGSLSDDQLLAIKPGSEIRLDVRIPSVSQKDLKRITDSLTQKLQANGLIVSSSRTAITLEAVVEQGKTESVVYESIGGSPRDRKKQSASVTQKITRISFKENGRLLWERRGTYGHAPALIQHKEGESVQSAVNRKQAPLSSYLQFFLNASLPQYVARYQEAGALGNSTLTPTGTGSMSTN